MVTINRVIVSKGNNKVDFSGNVPSPAENANVKEIDLEKNTPTPVTNTISTGNTTVWFSNVADKHQKPTVTVTAGTYTTAFSKGGSDVTYNLERIGNVIKITGTIKYVSANANVSLAAGNHVILDFKHPNISSTSALPSGTIVKVTHTELSGNYNTATKDAFESDGSLVIAVNLATAASLPLSEPREVKVAWTADKDGNLIWERYILDFSGATLGANA